MKRQVRALIYGCEQEFQDAVKALEAQADGLHPQLSCVRAKDYEELRTLLVEWDPCVVVVLEDGAAGMEGVYLVRNSSAAVPVFWFSDDRGFGMQSHRLECAYFSTKPVTTAKMRSALHQCAHMGIQLGTA